MACLFIRFNIKRRERSIMEKIVKYQHHNELVSVMESLLGLHKEYCLCYLCDRFHPNEPTNCDIAEEVHDLDIKHSLVTPVWECPKFVLKSE